MLNPRSASRSRSPSRRPQGQRGMVLLVALVVLVAMTVAGIAMIRSVDTATLVAGNLAFQQAATRASDKGIEQAIAIVRAKSLASPVTTHQDDPTSGYFATLRAADSPSGTTTWQSFWSTNYAASGAYAMPKDQFGNQVFFVIHRECANASPSGAGGQCVASPSITTSTGNSQEAGEIELNAASQVYYRITVRVTGPRRTESYVQSHVTM